MHVHTCQPFPNFPIFRKSAGASHCSGPQRMSSYCGFGAPEQLDEFMVSAKKRRSLSFCQSWFPPRSTQRPLWAAKEGGSVGHKHVFWKKKKKNVERSFWTLQFLLLVLHCVAKHSEPRHAFWQQLYLMPCSLNNFDPVKCGLMKICQFGLLLYSQIDMR